MQRMRCAGYARGDSWKSEIRIPAIEEQLSDISAYIGRHPEMELTAVYSDEMGGKEFYKMIKDGLEGRFECIAFQSIYFAAETFPEMTGQVKEVAYAAGLHFIAIDECFTSIGKTEAEVQDYFAEKLTERHADIFRNWKKSRGKAFVLTNSVPFGYVRRNGENRMVKERLLQDVLDTIFEKLRSGEGMKEIAEWLNQSGVDTPGVWRDRRNGKKPVKKDWTAQMVRQMIINPVYTGARVNRRREVIEADCHEPYISAEKFNKLFPGRYVTADKTSEGKRATKENRAKVEKTGAKKNSGAGLKRIRLTCTGCGQYFFTQGRAGAEYQCSCGRIYRGIHTEAVEKKIAKELEKECSLARKMEAAIRSGGAEDVRIGRREAIAFQVRQFAAQMELGQVQQVPLYQDFQNGKIVEEEYRKKKKEMEGIYHEIDRKLEEALSELEATDRCLSLKNPWLTRYTSMMEFQGDALRRSIDRVEAGPSGEFHIVFRDAGWKEMLMGSLQTEIQSVKG